MKINEAINAMLDNRGCTKADLAFKMGTTPQAIYQYVNGQKGRLTSVTVDTAFEIADALDYTLALVPKSRTGRLPDGTMVIDERLTEKRARKYSKE